MLLFYIWLVFLGYLLVKYVLGAIFTIKGIIFIAVSGAVAFGLSKKLPKKFLSEKFWLKLPPSVTAFLVYLPVYVWFFTLGKIPEIDSLKTWTDWLIFRHGMPLTTVHKVSALVAFTFAVYIYRYIDMKQRGGGAMPQDSEEILSGGKLIDFTEAKNKTELVLKENEPQIFWAGLNLPQSAGTEHFAIVGSPGSGKTISMRLLMQSILPRIKSESKKRAIIFDAKRDSLSILAGMNLSSKVLVMNPFDKRSTAWDISADIADGATANEAASSLIPSHKGESQPFFTNAARAVLGGVMEALSSIAPKKWTLRDVVLTLRTSKRIRLVLGACKKTEYLILKYANDSRRDEDIAATLETHFRRLSFVAAAWAKAENKISLDSWLKSNSIMLLGSDPSQHEILSLVNRLILKRLIALVRSKEEA